MKSNMLAIGALTACFAVPTTSLAGTRGADELFWVPTFEQALEMASHTGRPIFLVHYTCVGERSPTYSGKATVF
jgi:hypothetical protein